MNKIILYIKYPLKNIPIISSQFTQIRLKSDKEDGNSNEAPKVNLTNKEAVDKLNRLLNQIIKEDVVASSSNLELAKPKQKRPAKQESKIEKVETHTVEKNIVSSVKDVAELLGGNTKQTESELLSKLLNSVDASAENKETVSTNLSDIIKGMKIDRSTKVDVSRAQQVKTILQTSKDSKSGQILQTMRPKWKSRSPERFDDRAQEREKINLFGGKPLNIFSDVNQYTDTQINKTWQKLHERELRLAVTHPPSNYFQQLILWTEQGKVWKFPIDNEQGMEEEHNIYFTEHVFLEKHLEPWCPPKGPIRHFMELVCIGLSKNPYTSVKHKQEHIAWYRDYFLDKKKLLEEVDAIPPGFEMKSTEAKDADVIN